MKIKKQRRTRCPVCGELTLKCGITLDGRAIRTCGDATREKFHPERVG